MQYKPHAKLTIAQNILEISFLMTPRLSVALEVEGVVALPGLAATGGGVVEAVTLSETTGLLAGGGEATRLAVLVDGGDDPVDAGIAADGLVLGVDEDDLEVLVGGVLVDPVRVENTQVGAATSDTLLGSRLERSLVLELVHTLVGRLACIGCISKNFNSQVETVISYHK
jgi:hypothetical protein